MKTPITEMVKAEPVLLDAKHLIDWMFGMGQTGMNLLRLVVSGHYSSSQLEMWLRARWLDDGTREWAQADGGWAERSKPTLAVLLSTYASMPIPERHTSTSRSYTTPGTEISIGPMLHPQMAAAIQAPWTVLWAAANVRVTPPSYGQPSGIVDVDDRQKVHERFRSCSTPPHVLVDEGDRLVGLWRLDTPFEDKEDPLPTEGFNAMQVIARQRSPIAPRRGARLLHKLAHVLRGDIDTMAKSELATFLLPGQKVNLRIADAPSLIVTATLYDPDGRVSIEALEQMADEVANNLRG